MSKVGKKLRKLRRDPGKFMDDFVANRKRQFAALRRKPKTSFVAGSAKSSRRYSVISAVYNVESYLDEFFSSLTGQTLDFRSCIELVVVDDGSPDNSAAIIRKWQRKYPNNITYLRKKNGGQASARNLGLEYATGRWITFTDPDDFVALDYFQQVDNAIAGAKVLPAMVSCNFIYYYTHSKQYSNTHPLKYRFAKGTQVVDFTKQVSQIQLTMNSVFFDAEVIAKNDLRLDDRIKPTFEDAHFVNRYLMHSENRPTIFCPAAKYCYRKRSDNTSAVDTSWEKEGQYTDVLEHGVLALLHAWSSSKGSVPVFVQRTALYQVMWYLKRLLNNDKRLTFLTDAQRMRFVELLHEIFIFIDKHTIDKFDLAGIWFMHRVGLLATFKADRPNYQIVYAEGVDFTRRLIKIRYFTDCPSFESFRFDGVEVTPIFATSRTHTFVGQQFVQDRIVWLPLRMHAELTVMLDCDDVRLSLQGKQHKALSVADIYAHFAAARKSVATEPSTSAKVIRWLAKLPLVQNKYQAAWALMDRDVQADDNAEHLYRYLRKSQPEINAFFLLVRSSHDWKRLKREGFRLVAFGGLRHKILMLNADHLISSHIDSYVIHPLSAKDFSDKFRHRFTFLQHGVTQNDIADWLNVKEIDCFITSAPRELHSLVDVGTRYKFSRREVVLTGFPRHDLLVKASDPQKIVLVMPTWRESLMGEVVPGTARRKLNLDFSSSSYFKEWNGLLATEALSDLARSRGYRIVFYPHANVQAYSNLFRLPDNVELLLHTDGSIQEVFKSAALMITDYSSVAFEFALMQRPIVYFQFDREQVFSGSHIVQKGYFDYHADGFGPVCDTRAEVLDAVADILADDCKMAPNYLARAETFLPLRDGRNCERTFEAIRALDKPAVATRQSADEAMEALEQAVSAARWNIVVERVARIVELDDITDCQRTQALLRGSQASRKLGDAEAAARMLKNANLDPQADLAATMEFAEVASMRANWNEAVALWKHVIKHLPVLCEEHTHVHALQRLIDAQLQIGLEGDALASAAQLLNSENDEQDALPAYAGLSRVALESGEVSLARRLAITVLGSSHPNIDTRCKARAYATLAALLERVGDPMKARGMWMRALRTDALDDACAAAFDALVDWQESWTRDEWIIAQETSSMFADVLGQTHTAESSNELDVALTLCAMHRAIGETDVAMHVLAMLQLDYPKDVFVYLEAAELALAAGDYTNAEKQFALAQATPCGARLGRVARGLLITRQALGKLKNLNTLASTVVAKRPYDLAATRAAAMIASAEERWNDAYDGWQTVLTQIALEDTDERTDALLKLTEALLGLGQLEEAQQVLSGPLLDTPGQMPVLRAFAELATKRGIWELAVTAWRDVESKAAALEDRRYASRMLTQALWFAGHEKLARDRMCREIEGTAFTALASGDLLRARRTMSRVAYVRNSGAWQSKADDAPLAESASHSVALTSTPFGGDVKALHPGIALKTPRIVTAFVDMGDDD